MDDPLDSEAYRKKWCCYHCSIFFQTALELGICDFEKEIFPPREEVAACIEWRKNKHALISDEKLKIIRKSRRGR